MTSARVVWELRGMVGEGSRDDGLLPLSSLVDCDLGWMTRSPMDPRDEVESATDRVVSVR